MLKFTASANSMNSWFLNSSTDAHLISDSVLTLTGVCNEILMFVEHQSFDAVGFATGRAPAP